MAKYAISTYGRHYVIDEQLESLPTERVVFILITLSLGFVVQYYVTRLFYKLWTERKRSLIMSSLFTLYSLSTFIHTIHYADNIARPVDYFEPKWLYKKYLFSVMEITFCANFPITIFAYLSVKQLLISMVSGDSVRIKHYCLLFMAYIFGSLLTLGHYRTEPPTSYSLFVNFTIAGEGVVAFCLILVIARILCLNKRNMFGGPDKDLAKLLAAVNYDDSDEEVVTYRREEFRGLTRKRSNEKLNNASNDI